jgi:hypothetical protein
MKIKYLLLLLTILASLNTYSQEKRNKVEIGSFIEDIYSIDYQNSKYQIIFWIWINSNDETYDFLKDFDLSNCDEFEITSVLHDSLDGKYHSECKVRATILNQFNVVNYPFDIQDIKLRMEFTKYTDLEKWNLTFDEKNSKLVPEFIQDWKISNTKAEINNKSYNSNFGDLYSKEPFTDGVRLSS